MSKLGRKPVEDKKQRIEVWVRKSKIKEKGGKEPLKKLLTEFAEK